MTEKQPRREDRRTTYTKNAIKDALLSLMEQKPFDKITITEVCRTAEINRGTYYLHYYELTEVLDELLDDAIAQTDAFPGSLEISAGCSADQCDNSLCRLIRHSQKYRVVFMDESLTGRIIEKIARHHKADFIRKLTERSSCTEAQADALFYFQINGCFAISKRGRDCDCDSWMAIRQAVDPFISGGIEKVISNAK